jgi:pimeloyl-ACP methyl ester carboxylesterase
MTGARAAFSYQLGGPEQAPVLVLGNSMGTTMAMWDDQLGPLAERLRVLRYDHRGHGAAEVPPGPTASSSWAPTSSTCWTTSGSTGCRSVGSRSAGWSGCGWPPTPERIERLALCCTSAKVDPATPRPHAEAIVAAIGGARPEVVAGAAHLANIEQPQRVTGQLLDHFTDPSAT